MEQPVQYKVWIDRGGNFGLQCVDCGRTTWTGQEAIHQPTGMDLCPNFTKLVLQRDTLAAQAKSVHDQELQEYDQALANAGDDEEARSAVVLQCVHSSSQPL